VKTDAFAVISGDSRKSGYSKLISKIHNLHTVSSTHDEITGIKENSCSFKYIFFPSYAVSTLS